VLFNNIFNRNEFELYGRGQLIEPPRQCECYFKHECTSSLGTCMQDVKPDYVYDVVATMLSTPA
jgi:heptosyltransferase-2